MLEQSNNAQLGIVSSLKSATTQSVSAVNNSSQLPSNASENSNSQVFSVVRPKPEHMNMLATIENKYQILFNYMDEIAHAYEVSQKIVDESNQQSINNRMQDEKRDRAIADRRNDALAKANEELARNEFENQKLNNSGNMLATSVSLAEVTDMPKTDPNLMGVSNEVVENIKNNEFVATTHPESLSAINSNVQNMAPNYVHVPNSEALINAHMGPNPSAEIIKQQEQNNNNVSSEANKQVLEKDFQSQVQANVTYNGNNTNVNVSNVIPNTVNSLNNNELPPATINNQIQPNNVASGVVVNNPYVNNNINNFNNQNMPNQNYNQDFGSGVNNQNYNNGFNNQLNNQNANFNNNNNQSFVNNPNNYQNQANNFASQNNFTEPNQIGGFNNNNQAQYSNQPWPQNNYQQGNFNNNANGNININNTNISANNTPMDNALDNATMGYSDNDDVMPVLDSFASDFDDEVDAQNSVSYTNSNLDLNLTDNLNSKFDPIAYEAKLLGIKQLTAPLDYLDRIQDDYTKVIVKAQFSEFDLAGLLKSRRRVIDANNWEIDFPGGFETLYGRPESQKEIVNKFAAAIGVNINIKFNFTGMGSNSNEGLLFNNGECFYENSPQDLANRYFVELAGTEKQKILADKNFNDLLESLHLDLSNAKFNLVKKN